MDDDVVTLCNIIISLQGMGTYDFDEPDNWEKLDKARTIAQRIIGKRSTDLDTQVKRFKERIKDCGEDHLWKSRGDE